MMNTRLWIRNTSVAILVTTLWCAGPLTIRAAGDDSDKKPASGAVAEKSLYERLGGVQAIAAVVDDFVNRLVQNPTVMANENVRKAAESGRVTVPGLKFLLTEQICAAAGGPQKYSGRKMKEAHKDLMISEAEWKASAADLTASLEKFKVPKKEQDELFVIIASTHNDIVTKKEAVASPISEDDLKDVRTVYDEVAKRLNARDADSAAAFVAPDARFILADGRTISRDTYGALVRQKLITLSAYHVRFDITPVSKNDDTITVLATRHATATDTGEDGKPRTIESMIVCRDTFKRMYGKWLLVSSTDTKSEAKTGGTPASGNNP
jgi:hemoglobin